MSARVMQNRSLKSDMSRRKVMQGGVSPSPVISPFFYSLCSHDTTTLSQTNTAPYAYYIIVPKVQQHLQHLIEPYSWHYKIIHPSLGMSECKMQTSDAIYR